MTTPPLPAARRLLNASRELMSVDDVHAVARYAVEVEKALAGIAYGKWGDLSDAEIACLMETIAVEALSAAGPAGEEPCEHEWVDARNQAVESGELCVRCHAIRAGPAGEEASNTVLQACDGSCDCPATKHIFGCFAGGPEA